MLILAGVSLNAIIGDNGIITRAQEATVLQNCANLEEYLNQEYIVGVADDKVENGESEVKLTPLEQMIRLHSDYFFKNGSYDYVIYEYTSDEGKTEYLKIRLINKEKLGGDVKNQLSIGDAKGNSREAYLEFEDVFGVTDDLKVFYCKKGILSAIGADFLKSSLLDSSKVMQKKDSPASKALAESTSTEARDLTVSDLWSTRELIVSNNSGAENLSFLIDMPNVEKLTLKNYGGSLSGIGNLINLTYLCIDNTDKMTNISYEELSLADKLEELYFYMPTNEEVRKMCEEMGKTTYENLTKLSLCGYQENDVNRHITSLAVSDSRQVGNSDLTTLESLNLLGETKKKITTLYVNNNKITDLSGVEGFINLKKLYLNNNSVQIAGNSNAWTIVVLGDDLKNMKELTDLFISYCNIQNDDFSIIAENTNLEKLSIYGNDEIVNLECLIDLSKLKGLGAKKCTKLNLTANVVKKIAFLEEKYLDDKYNTTLSLANPGKEVYLSSDAKGEDLKILEESKEKIEIFELVNNTIITDEELQEFLPKLTNMNTLIADGSNLESFDFIKAKNGKLKHVSVANTKIMNLQPLSFCSELCSLRINTPNLNLRQYSKIINDMCARVGSWNCNQNMRYKCGVLPLGGLVAPIVLLNTLNGTEVDPNLEITEFSSYGGNFISGPGTLDLSNTGLTTLGICWFSKTVTIIVPEIFESVRDETTTGAKIDYSNVYKCNNFFGGDIGSVNIENFQGYETIKTFADPLTIIGENTKTLWFGFGLNRG